MKSTILITVQYLEIGGVERSLIGLLGAIDYTRYDVDLFVYRHTGELMPLIPKDVNLLPEVAAYAALARPLLQILKEGHIGITLGRLCAKIQAKQFGKRHKTGENYSVFQFVANNTTCFLPVISDKTYDLAISFLTPHNIVCDKVKAKKKIAWIHTDYTAIEIDLKGELPIWNSFDSIASISENVSESFLRKFPSLSSKIILIENILSPAFIQQQAALESVVLPGEVKILTVGRFCYPKAIDNAVRICASLVQMGVHVKWYVIGYGDVKTVQEVIESCNMQEYFIILGKKINPYPYMAACDVYVQPSRYEGKAVTVREAQILNKPVVITNYPTAKSQLTDGFDGVIVPMDIQQAALGIKDLIENKNLQQQLMKNMLQIDYGNSTEVDKIYNLIG